MKPSIELNPYRNHPDFNQCAYCRYAEKSLRKHPCNVCVPAAGTHNDSKWSPSKNELDYILGLK